jgi:hypothetical protein
MYQRKTFAVMNNAFTTNLLELNRQNQVKEAKVADLRSSSITADVLNILTDCKIHTMQEIADEVEVSKRTVIKHITSLSYRFPIETFHGGDKHGGVFLNKTYIMNGHLLTKTELKFGSKIFNSVQRMDLDNEECRALDGLLRIFTAELCVSGISGGRNDES